jgi:hypothetical protein
MVIWVLNFLRSWIVMLVLSNVSNTAKSTMCAEDNGQRRL